MLHYFLSIDFLYSLAISHAFTPSDDEISYLYCLYLSSHSDFIALLGDFMSVSKQVYLSGDPVRTRTGSHYNYENTVDLTWITCISYIM